MGLRWTEEQYRAYVTKGQAPPISEDVFLAAVLKIARSSGFLAYHTYRSTKSAEGFPDVVLAPGPRIAGAGHPLYVCELKTDTGIVSQAQEAWLEALGRCNGVVSEIWRPHGLEEIVKRLRQ